MSNYKPRVVDTILADKLNEKGAVVIEGPKWCGKTTTASQVAKSILRMDEPKNATKIYNNQRLIQKFYWPEKHLDLLMNGKSLL